MRAIQSTVYAFSGINIFAKATAQSMNKTAESAKQTNKSLGGMHGEINNISGDNNGSSSNTIDSNINLSEIGTQMDPISQKLYDFFVPLKDSWDTYGSQVIISVNNALDGVLGSLNTMWNSIEKTITNGTIYSIVSNIINTIGNIGESWSNAWSNNNGEELIQNIGTIINDLSTAINNITSDEGFQLFLDGVVKAFNGLSELVQPVVDDLTALIQPITDISLSTVGTVLNAIGDALKWIGDNEIAVTIVESLALAIGAVTIATSIFKTVKQLETGVLMANATAWIAANLPIVLIIAAITAVITIIILCIKYWDIIKGVISNVCENVKAIILEWVNNLKEKFNVLKDTISNVLNTIKTVWSNVWNSIKTTVVNIWNGIWAGIKGVINAILGGIESFVNGIVKGINVVLKGISDLANAVGSLVGIDPINLRLNTITLPRLAKGNVAYSPMLALFGEYAGASSNPEITTPQNIMRETFDEVLSNHEWSNQQASGGELKQLVVQFGSTKVALEIERLLQQARRQNGIATVTI